MHVQCDDPEHVHECRIHKIINPSSSSRLKRQMLCFWVAACFVYFVNSNAINTDLFIDCGAYNYAIPCDQMSQTVENFYLSSSSS